MSWTILITGKARKQIKKLPQKYQDSLVRLLREIETEGPCRQNWQNYGQLAGRPGYHHCHLNKGKPRYVAVWKKSEKILNCIEVRYVGTHEKADYKRIF